MYIYQVTHQPSKVVMSSNEPWLRGSYRLYLRVTDNILWWFIFELLVTYGGAALREIKKSNSFITAGYPSTFRDGCPEFSQINPPVQCIIWSYLAVQLVVLSRLVGWRSWTWWQLLEWQPRGVGCCFRHSCCQTNSGVSITYPMNEAPVAATTPTPEPASQASLTTTLASSLWVNRERTSGREEINAVRKPSR